MDKRNLVLGGTLVLLGVASLVLTLAISLLGIDVFGFFLRFWPVAVSAVGLLFVLPPLLVRSRSGLGALFIPGVPILVTAGLLLVASVLDAWGLWAWLWPMVILGLALGFLAAAIATRAIWLLIPATILGLNGLLFQFCALTGAWRWWSVLWTAEPLSVGLPLVFIGLRKGTPGLATAGLVLSGLAVAGFVLMVTVLGSAWLLRLLGPGTLILFGLGVLGWGLLRRHPAARAALE